MKRIGFALAFLSSMLALNGQIVDTYAFRMNLKVPRIYNNS